MILSVSLSQEGVPTSVRDFIIAWKEKKGYGSDDSLNVGQCIELLIAVSYNFHTEESDGRFFNFMLRNEESVVAWEGSSLIHILLFEIEKYVKQRLNQQYRTPPAIE